MIIRVRHGPLVISIHALRKESDHFGDGLVGS